MKPIYVDLHIHTSENPNVPNLNYPCDILIKKVSENACGNDFLISLTDHNMINTKAYLDVQRLTSNILLGAELHIRKYDNSPAYHCHIFFNIEVNEENINKINSILDNLYPDKHVNDDNSDIPNIEKVISQFDSYDFILLPHGGQSVRTFDKAVPRNGKVKFDDTLERSLYYNQIDGFTARSNRGIVDTIKYFEKLGISSFVNLVTGSDNYTPQIYPSTKASEAGEFVPTWMYSTPTFQGLRLSLSESTRLGYTKKKPNDWFGCIGKVALRNKMLDIDVTLTPGLNVVIGGSSSGKTLFVDSLFRSIKKTLDKSDYDEFDVAGISVHNPSHVEPYYIPQNYIVSVLADKDKDISAIDLVQKVFPVDQEVSELIRTNLAELKRDLLCLIDTTKAIETLENSLKKIPTIALVVAREKGKQNFLKSITGKKSEREKFALQKLKFEEYTATLDNISLVLENNPMVDNCDRELETIKTALKRAYAISEFEKAINSIITKSRQKIDELLQAENAEIQRKQKNREELLSLITEYIEKYSMFCLTKKSYLNII